ncbi:MAG: rhomboid family intramembrane serine protease [Verrucomicrobiae bacterium]|nr:rhomboid family intramembrane serine protease [Verrucomicrobiae bacterium]
MSLRSFDDAGWSVRPTPAVKWLLGINFAVFLLQQVFRAMGNQLFADFLKLSAQKIHEGCLWQFVTYMFLHGSVIHLLLNLLMLYFFGNEVEFALGPKHFLVIYFGGGIFGGLTWFAFNFHTATSMVGASGAVYAVALAFASLYPHRPITLLVFFVLPVTLLAKYWALVAVALSVLFLISDDGGNVAHLAHLGGMAVGWLYVRRLRAAAAAPSPRPSRRDASGHPPVQTLQPRLRKSEYIARQVDPILDKIAEHGIQSLTREERRILDEAKDRLS